MKMTKTQLGEVERHIVMNFVVGNCRLCGSDEWEVEETVFHLCSFSHRHTCGEPERPCNDTDRCENLPVVVMVCKQCGGIQLVSAKSIGVVGDPHDHSDDQDHAG